MVARASSPSFLRALPVESTRAESLGGTSTTDSPAADSLPARCLPQAASVLHLPTTLAKPFRPASSKDLRPSLGSTGS